MMNTDHGRIHITDDLGNDVVAPTLMDREYDALCAVAEAAEETHRAHCLLHTADCPICKALDALDAVRRAEFKAEHN